MCRSKVKIAQTRELPLPVTIYFAPERNHFELDEGRFSYSLAPPVDGHHPSVTVTFKSPTSTGGATASISLTGVERDGAAGIRAVVQSGDITIAQDGESCVVFGMPQEAIALVAYNTFYRFKK